MAQRRQQSPEVRLERLIKLQSLMAKVSRDIGAALELEPVLKTVLSAMRSMVEFRGGTVQLVDERGCYIAAADPPVTAELANSRVPVGTGLSGTAVAKAETIYAPDLDADRRVNPEQRSRGNNASTHSYLAVPLIVLGQCIGVMQMDSEEIDAFDAEDIAVLEGLATQVAGAIESARRYEHILGLERLKDDFIERISHELRTPLSIVVGFTDLLLAKGDVMEPHQQRDALQRIKVAVNRLGGLLEEILYISSLEAGSSRVRREDVTITDMVADVRAMSRDPEAVQLDIDPGLVFPVDALIFRHIVSQLMDNALKYAGDAVVSARLDPEKGELIMSVRDHGPGIPADHRPLVFQRFWRGKQRVAGMGLGLATARQLAASMDSTIEVLDPPGGGTEMRVWIPRAAGKTEANAAAERAIGRPPPAPPQRLPKG